MSFPPQHLVSTARAHALHCWPFYGNAIPDHSFFAHLFFVLLPKKKLIVVFSLMYIDLDR